MPRRPISEIQPYQEWPEAARATWESRAPTWSKTRSVQVRREYGRLLAWLDERDVPEGQLTADLLASYGAWLRERAPGRPGLDYLGSLIHALLIVRPEVNILRFQRVVADWSREHSEQVRGRPPRPGNHSPRENTLGVPYRSWTAEQRRAWDQATRVGGKYLDGGPLAGYRPSTLEAFHSAYCLWLGFLHRNGHGESLPTPALVESSAVELSERTAAANAARTLGRLRKVLEALHPGLELEHLRRHQRRLAGRAEPSPSKLPRLAHPSELVDAGERLMDRARRGLRIKANAIVFRDGLLVVLLARRPARISNVQSIRSGKELDLEAPEGRVSWTAEQTKNRANLSFCLTGELVDLLREWWEVYRPILVTDRAGKSLWLSEKGGPLTVAGLRRAIAKRTNAELGKRIPPHLFRDCLASMIAYERPDRIDDVSALLGHRRPGSKDNYIAVAKSLVAQRYLQKLEEETRRKSGRRKSSFRSAAVRSGAGSL